jgi:hypothetical protein
VAWIAPTPASGALAEHLAQTHGVRVAERTMHDFCRRHGIRHYRPTYRFLRADADKQEQARKRALGVEKRRSSRRCVLLGQDEARFAMVPTLTRTLSIKGHPPVVGTRDNKDLAYVVGSLDLVSGKLVQRVVPNNCEHLCHARGVSIANRHVAITEGTYPDELQQRINESTPVAGHQGIAHVPAPCGTDKDRSAVADLERTESIATLAVSVAVGDASWTS